MREPVPPRPMTGPPDPMAQPSHGTSPWNLPNALTVLRILLVPVFGSMLLAQDGADAGQRFAALAVFVVAMITDRIDGDIARSRGLVTDVGKILDPIADKALLGMAFVGLSLIGSVPWWVTLLVLAREVGSPSVLLERGAAVFSVAPRGNRPPFVVRAGDTVIRVVGTGFRVGRSEDHVTVAVDHGIVDVIHRGATHRLTAHQAWSSDHPDEVTELAAATTPTTTPATTVAQATPAPATTAAPEPTPAPAPAVVAPPRPRPTPPAIVTPAPPAPPSGPSISAADAARTEFDRLVQLEARDPAAALAGYLTLSAGNTVWSEVALFAAGRLAADRHDRRAKTLLTIYLRRFPRGANVRDARNLLDRLKGAPE